MNGIQIKSWQCGDCKIDDDYYYFIIEMGIKFASIKASQAVVHNIGVDYTKKIILQSGHIHCHQPK